MTKKLLVCFACFFLLASVAMADFVTVTPVAFNDDDDEAGARNCSIWGEYVSDSGGVWLLAPVNLPHGAVVKNMRVHYLDNAANDIWINFYRVNKWTGVQEYIFQVTTTGAENTIRSVVDSTCTPAARRMIYNNSCNYIVAIGFNTAGTAQRIYGITIEYD